MYNNDTAKVFWKSDTNLRGLNNGSDLFIYPVPDYAIHLLRNNFQLNIDEIVLYARDTSFWNNKNQGTVVTDWGVRYICDNDSINQIVQIKWIDVLYVEYNGESLYFFFDEERNNHYAIHISQFLKENNPSYGRKLADIFTRMAKTQDIEKIIDETFAEYNKLIEKGKTDEAILVALKYRKEYDDLTFSPSVAELYYKKGQYEKAISLLTEDYNSLSIKDIYWHNVLNYYKYDIYNKIGDINNARRYCLEVKQHSTLDMEFNDINLLQVSNKDFELIEKQFIQNFLNFPYEERKLIVPVKKYSELSQNTFSVMNIKKLPPINFPVGHPIANQLYVGHPYIPSRYTPFEKYELELLEDKIREFCHVMQFLGATEITIGSINSLSKKKERIINSIISGGINYKSVSGNVDWKHDKVSRYIDDISKSISLHQKFTPKASPCLPSDLVWYPNEPSWQRIYEQRMQGNFDFNEHEEHIETIKSQVIENSELKQISLELKNLIIHGNGKWEESINEKLEAHENSVISIRVKFAPLDKLGKISHTKKLTEEIRNKKASLKDGFVNLKTTIIGKVENVITINTPISSKEKEYLNEVKICLEEDKIISPQERRFLNHIRAKLGISEKRASVLEAILFQPLLAKNEQEYFDEYKICMAKEGEITPKVRRMLDKLRNRLCISEERALEIEKLY